MTRFHIEITISDVVVLFVKLDAPYGRIAPPRIATSSVSKDRRKHKEVFVSALVWYWQQLCCKWEGEHVTRTRYYATYMLHRKCYVNQEITLKHMERAALIFKRARSRTFATIPMELSSTSSALHMFLPRALKKSARLDPWRGQAFNFSSRA